MAPITETIGKYLEPLAPYVEYIVIFMTPIYVFLGKYMGMFADWFLGILPADNMLIAYIIMGVFIVLGIYLGVKTDPEN